MSPTSLPSPWPPHPKLCLQVPGVEQQLEALQDVLDSGIEGDLEVRGVRWGSVKGCTEGRAGWVPEAGGACKSCAVRGWLGGGQELDAVPVQVISVLEQAPRKVQEQSRDVVKRKQGHRADAWPWGPSIPSSPWVPADLEEQGVAGSSISDPSLSPCPAGAQEQLGHIRQEIHSVQDQLPLQDMEERAGNLVNQTSAVLGDNQKTVTDLDGLR